MDSPWIGHQSFSRRGYYDGTGKKTRRHGVSNDFDHTDIRNHSGSNYSESDCNYGSLSMWPIHWFASLRVSSNDAALLKYSLALSSCFCS